MTTHPSAWRKWSRWSGQGALFLGFSAGVVVLLLWLAGGFQPKVPQTVAEDAVSGPSQGKLVEVRLVRRPLEESAVGTIRAVHETSLGSKLLARVVEVNLKAGQGVAEGDVLIRLDDTDLQAKLQQAKAALASAEAVQQQAKTDEHRFGQLIKTHSISQQEYDKTVTALRSAEADALRAQEAVREVQAMLDWATIRSPITGVVIDKRVDVGDMVTPGQVLVTLFDPKRMQLVASVRESLARRLQPGPSIDVEVQGLGKRCSGTISEIVPEAQSASRAFQVKVTGPCPTGIYSGMFGQILIPLDEEQVLIIPRTAVRRVGQLELVQVAADGRTAQRAIRAGRTFGPDVEILSGLQAGEQVMVPPTD